MPPIIPDRFREEERTDHRVKDRGNAAAAQWAGHDISAMQQLHARDRVLSIAPVCRGRLFYGGAVNAPVAGGTCGSDRGTAVRASGKQCVS